MRHIRTHTHVGDTHTHTQVTHSRTRTCKDAIIPSTPRRAAAKRNCQNYAPSLLCPYSPPLPTPYSPLPAPPPTRAHSAHMCKRTQRTCFGPRLVESLSPFANFFLYISLFSFFLFFGHAESGLKPPPLLTAEMVPPTPFPSAIHI